MSERVLGLDIGPSSIGWSLIDAEAGKTLAASVRVFPEGVDRDQKGGEQSKSQTRRTARGMRRQIARRAARKRRLRDVLTEAGLLPRQPDALDRILAVNPYPLRARAMDKPLEPHEIGRVFVHLNQRRGFLSNRKTDRPRAKETRGMLDEIDDLERQIGCRTLGKYLDSLDDDFDHRSSPPEHRVRHRHTRRDMYEREFDAIWKAQRAHHSDLLTDELKDNIRRVIFFQREMYWPRSVVGRCELEPKLKRCPRADRAAQRFRILQEVNNLRLLDRATGHERRLSDSERATLVAYLSEARHRTFDQIRKKLGLGEHVRFNLEGPERDKLKGHETDAALAAKGALGKRWAQLPDQVKDAIVTVLIQEEREEEALRHLTNECALTRDEAEQALRVNLPDGYVSFSRQAIEKLLPHLERGLLLMADDASNSALHAAGYLRPDEREVRQRNFLPPAPFLTNPIVRQALVEVRKLVNAIIREYGKPGAIHVELAREAKNSFEQRRQLRFEMANRRRAREQAAQEIERAGDKPTSAKIEKYLLWQEQQHVCPYSGREISFAQLLSDAVSVDHILPRWRSLDDSLANKVVCFREENDAKGDRTPREWLEHSDPVKYEQVRQRVRSLPYNKQRKFIQKDIVLEDFVNRQLTDTAYIARCVSQYLRCLGAPIVTPRGQMTAELRHFWGLNTILDPEGRGQKNRADHRHHAIDAIVIALTDRKRLHALANDHGKDVKPPWEGFREDVVRAVGAIRVSHRPLRRLHGALHEDTFYGATQKRAATEAAPAGSLRRPWAKGWIESPNAFVHRKPITSIDNTGDLAKVRDDAVREILIGHLKKQGVLPPDYQLFRDGRLQKLKVPASAWKELPRMPSGVPIRKVRMIEESETFRRVSDRRPYQFVKPGNNHHIVYRATGEGAEERWTAEVVTMWEAAWRARKGRPIVARSDNENGRFIMSLSINEMFEIDHPDGQRRLCVVRKIDQRSKRIGYKLHTDARPATEINKDNLYLSPDRMRQLRARKVTVDLLGRIRNAND